MNMNLATTKRSDYYGIMFCNYAVPNNNHKLGAYFHHNCPKKLEI